MSDILVQYKVDEGVATITLDNAPANGYSHKMMLQLDAAILRARFDDDVHVIVLTGAGDRFFCAGADIALLGKMTPSFKYQFCLHANETLLRLEHTPKLVIGALNGHTVGGGLEVALACDLRVAKQDGGKMGLPEVALGVLPGTGGTQRLARVLGSSKAIELMVTGNNFTMKEGHSLGLVHRLFLSDSFRDSVHSFARSFCPPHKASLAVGLIKRSVQTGSQLPLESGLALERELQARLFSSHDATEGISAFTQKSPPFFTGR